MMKPRYQCNTCGEGADPRMCGQWNCCVNHEHLTNEPVFAIEHRYVSDYVADISNQEEIARVISTARSLCCESTVAFVGEDIWCRGCGKCCWLNSETTELDPDLR